MPYGISDQSRLTVGGWACYIGGFAASVAAPRTDGENDGLITQARPASRALICCLRTDRYVTQAGPASLALISEMPYGISAEMPYGISAE